MSYNISLNCKCCDRVLINKNKIQEGGTFTVGGIYEAELNVTYNYSKYFNFRNLDKEIAESTIPGLEVIVKGFGTEKDKDYWALTEGNVGYACSILLSFAKEHPEGIWETD